MGYFSSLRKSQEIIRGIIDAMMSIMPWTKQQIEEKITLRIRGMTDDDIKNADPDPRLGVAFYPVLSASEEAIADECWKTIIGSPLRKVP